MLNFFIPTSSNNHRAYLLSKPFLLLFMLIIFVFNSTVRVSISAQDLADNITIQSLLEEHNEKRKEAGLSELTINALLNQSAQLKAEAMMKSNCWSHYCPDGQSPWEYFEQANYEYIFAGENLAEGFFRIDDVMNAWMNSKTHRENIERKEYKEIGFGFAYGDFQGRENNLIIVVHFGSRLDFDNREAAKTLFLTKPKDGEVVRGSEIDLEGSSNDGGEISVYLNNELSKKASIGGGIFTIKVENLVLGENSIYAKLIDEDNSITESNHINIIYSPSESEKALLNSSLPPISISNAINIFFVAVLVVLFMLDFIILSRTNVLEREKSFSHYHLGVFIILGIVFMTGGFFGSLL